MKLVGFESIQQRGSYFRIQKSFGIIQHIAVYVSFGFFWNLYINIFHID